jgi:DNA-binding LytR/AlgR family response regulator
MWFTSDKNYIEVKTEERKYIIRSSLKNLLNQLPKTNFVKCGKQYIINTQHVNHFNNQTLNINGQNISISRNTRQQVLSKLKQ